MELRSITLMNNTIDALLDTWLSQMNISVATRGILCLS